MLEKRYSCFIVVGGEQNWSWKKRASWQKSAGFTAISPSYMMNKIIIIVIGEQQETTICYVKKSLVDLSSLNVAY